MILSCEVFGGPREHSKETLSGYYWRLARRKVHCSGRRWSHKNDDSTHSPELRKRSGRGRSRLRILTPVKFLYKKWDFLRKFQATVNVKYKGCNYLEKELRYSHYLCIRIHFRAYNYYSMKYMSYPILGSIFCPHTHKWSFPSVDWKKPKLDLQQSF